MPSPNQGQPLSICAGCFSQKLSCQTNEAGFPKRITEAREPEEPEEEGEGSEQSDGSGKVWMERFSMMKVGPPKGVKPAAY